MCCDQVIQAMWLSLECHAWVKHCELLWHRDPQYIRFTHGYCPRCTAHKDLFSMARCIIAIGNPLFYGIYPRPVRAGTSVFPQRRRTPKLYEWRGTPRLKSMMTKQLLCGCFIRAFHPWRVY